MKQPEAIALINAAIAPNTPQSWADLGCGSGTFTTALASLLPAKSIVHAVDKQLQSIPAAVGDVLIRFYKSDFEKDELPFGDLDGIMLANALHYVAEPLHLIRRLSKMLKSDDGKFLLIEYDRRQANQWVPYPIPFDIAVKLFTSAGYHQISKTGERPSRYGQATIYSMLACQS